LVESGKGFDAIHGVVRNKQMLVHWIVGHMPVMRLAKRITGRQSRIRFRVRRARKRSADRALDRNRQIRAMRQSSTGPCAETMKFPVAAWLPSRSELGPSLLPPLRMGLRDSKSPRREAR
jgi:hypothetical protein